MSILVPHPVFFVNHWFKVHYFVFSVAVWAVPCFLTYLRFWGSGIVAVFDRLGKSGKRERVPFLGDLFGTDGAADSRD